MKSALGREGHTPQYITKEKKPALKKRPSEDKSEMVESDSDFAEAAESTMQKLYNQAKEL